MRRLCVLFALTLIYASCQGPASNSQQAGDNDSLATDAASSDNWISLFNGNNLDGWRGYQNHSIDAWSVEDGTIHCNGHKEGVAPTDLITDKEYGNFELSVQWKLSKASNSGILFHVDEQYPHTYTSGPEYQLIDDAGWVGTLEPWQHTGSNYAMQVPDTIPTLPIGEWNTSKLVVNGAHVEHWLNGVKVLHYELWSPSWEAQKAAGKWKTDSAYGQSKSGHIALQYHGGDVWFRDLKIKPL